MSAIYLPLQSADQTSTDALADIAETEINLPEGYEPRIRCQNTGSSNSVTVVPFGRFRRIAASGKTELSGWIQLGGGDALAAGKQSIFDFGSFSYMLGAVKLQLKATTPGSQSDVEVSGRLLPMGEAFPDRLISEEYSANYCAAQASAQASTNDPADIAESEVAITAKQRGLFALSNSGADDVTVTWLAQYAEGSTLSGWRAVPTTSAITMSAGEAFIFDFRSMSDTAARVKCQIESTVDDTPGSILCFGGAIHSGYLPESISGTYDPTS